MAFCALPLFFTTVVAFEVVDRVLWLLTVRISGTGGGSIPRFERVDAGLATTGTAALAALRPAPGLPLVGLGFSATMSARLAVAAIAADLAGDSGLAKVNCFEGLMGFRGDRGRERWLF